LFPARDAIVQSDGERFRTSGLGARRQLVHRVNETPIKKIRNNKTNEINNGDILAMKLIRSFAGAALAVAVLAFASRTEAQTATLRIASNLPATHPTCRAMEIFKAEVSRLSGGSIQVEFEPGSPLGLKELIDAVHVGSLFATSSSIANFSRLVPEAAAMSLPFVFDNYDQAMRATAGPVGRLIATKLDAKGYTVLSWLALGEFNFTNSKRPIRTLDDFKGLRIRVLPNATHVATFQALGARVVSIDLKDVDAALRQGDVDGEEQDYNLTYNNKYYESQKYLSDTRHILEFHLMIANKGAFANLAPMQQKAVREAAAIAAVQEVKLVTEIESAAFARLREVGMQFDPLPSATRAALRHATASVVDDVKKWVGADVVNKVLTVNRPSGTAKEAVAASVPAVRTPADNGGRR
jgi:tripartite ATP-independent transporter DctP family solute receptor